MGFPIRGVFHGGFCVVVGTYGLILKGSLGDLVRGSM